MFKTLFFVLLGLYSVGFILFFFKRKKRQNGYSKLALIGLILNTVSTLAICVVYLYPSMEPSIMGMLLTLMLGTYLPSIIVPILLLAPTVISLVLTIIYRKADALKTTSAWLGLLIVGIALSWFLAALIA